MFRSSQRSPARGSNGWPTSFGPGKCQPARWWRAGAPARYLIVVEVGSLIAVHDARTGTRVRLSSVVAPCVIDKVATLDGQVHTATWMATRPCRLRLLPSELFVQLVEEQPELRSHLLSYLSKEANRLRRARIRQAAPGPLAQVADWLTEARRVHGDTVRLEGGQQGLGEEIGLSRVAVNRALQALVVAGVVRVRPRMVSVLNPERLEGAALLLDSCATNRATLTASTRRS